MGVAAYVMSDDFVPLGGPSIDARHSGRTFRITETQEKARTKRIWTTGDASVLGSLHSVDGEGLVRMENRLDTGIDDLWGALTDPDRLAHWYGEVEGELSPGAMSVCASPLGGRA